MSALGAVVPGKTLASVCACDTVDTRKGKAQDGDRLKEWSVAIGLGGVPASGPTADEQVAALAEKLADLAPAISAGPKSLTIRIAVEAVDAARAGTEAVAAIAPILEAVGLGMGPVQDLEVTEWSLFEDRLTEPTYPELVGITEIAEILKTSRQRASELARSSKFPAPHADLAAGPVWLKPTVMRFAGEWDRKPGRPKSATTKRLEPIIAERKDEEARA
ncbi:MAG: hypothetical protein M3323_04595 [Actinomycetota bacterium]|nr:hypothetical protein [Actinomycetota bacterium]